MDSEERIFGPLTFKQSIYLAVGSGIIYFAYNYLEPRIGIPISIIVGGGIFVAIFVNHKPLQPIDENYLKIMRSKCKNLEEFQQKCRRKIAEIQSQIETRKNKGLVADPTFSKALQLFQEALENEK